MEEQIRKYKFLTFRVLSLIHLIYDLIDKDDKIINTHLRITREKAEEYEIDESYKKIGLLEIENENLKNRIRILEEDFERLKKSQLERFFQYSSEDMHDSTDSE